VTNRRVGILGLCAMAVLFVASCDECAGTPSCTTTPELSYSGQFIDRATGKSVEGVSISFIRRAGAELLNDPSALSDGDGFFVLRTPALQEGFVGGDLRVVPPAPHVPYTIRDVTLATNSVRGDGGNLGRLVVQPFLFLVGHVRDRFTHAPLPNVQVTVRRLGGGRLAEDSMTFVTDGGGQFGWDAQVIDPEPIDASFEMTVEGHPRSYTVERRINFAYRDLEMTFVFLPVGWGLAYSAGTARRGSNAIIPGVQVFFRRLSGIATEPEATPLPVDANGAFPIAVTPLAEGSLTAELRVVPPTPFRPETTVVELRTSDDDVVKSLGFLKYGAQVFFSLALVDDADQPLPEGTIVMVRRLSGVALDLPAAPVDSGLRAIDSASVLTYQAPAADSGSMDMELIVRLPAPFAWDTIRPLTVPALYSDSAYDAASRSVRRRQR
jgi:hypothetical protein